MARDLTIHRCARECSRVARWKAGDDWFCKDHAPYGAVRVEPPPPPPPPELEYEVIGSASVRIRVKKK